MEIIKEQHSKIFPMSFKPQAPVDLTGDVQPVDGQVKDGSTTTTTTRTRALVCRRRDAYDEDGILKARVISLKELKEANLEQEVVSILEVEDDELHVAANAEDEYVLIEIVLDSGAGEHVADRLDAPGYAVEESAGSKRGQHFTAAGGHKMPNQRQMVLSIRVPDGSGGEEALASTFQVASVTRPLWSVSKICDAGYWAKFTAKGATIFDDKDVPVCVFERRGGLYVAKVRLKNPRHPSFARPANR